MVVILYGSAKHAILYASVSSQILILVRDVSKGILKWIKLHVLPLHTVHFGELYNSSPHIYSIKMKLEGNEENIFIHIYISCKGGILLLTR